MTEHESLLQAIYHNPLDDTIRLVYADYLQDNFGEDTFEYNHAELIRVQIGLVGDQCNQFLLERQAVLEPLVEPVVRRGERCGNCDGMGKVFEGKYGRKSDCPDCHGGWAGVLAEHHTRVRRPDDTYLYDWSIRCDWFRGFPFRVYCTLAEYRRVVGTVNIKPAPELSVAGGTAWWAKSVTWAEQLLREHGTVTEVVLTDLMDERMPHWLGAALQNVPTYPVVNDTAVAHAAANHARKLAELPLLGR